MAKSGVVCSNCGNEVSASDQFCSQCGHKVGKESTGSPKGLELVTCEVCGHENAHGGAFCEACGAKLAGVPAGKGVSKPATSATKRGKSSKKEVSTFKFEMWHYVVGAVVLAVVGVLVYVEIQRDHPAGSTATMQFPAAQTPPPSQEILDAINRLQQTVSDNPNDTGAKLLLANALHDGAMHDGRLLPRAIDAYQDYLKEKPGDPNARVDLGICYFELGKIDSAHSAQLFAQAISEMESAVKGTPTHQPGAFNLGIVYLYSGNLKESNKWFQRAVELNAGSDLGKRAKAILEQHNPAG